jgi:hypothetical protein
MDEHINNAYQSPEAEDDVRPLAADNPLAVQRANALGLVLWAGWLMVVLVAIVWLVG